jgi:hypothetical protein
MFIVGVPLYYEHSELMHRTEWKSPLSCLNFKTLKKKSRKYKNKRWEIQENIKLFVCIANAKHWVSVICKFYLGRSSYLGRVFAWIDRVQI